VILQVRNDSGAPLEICQQGLEAHFVHRLSPAEALTFHWGDSSKRRRLRFRGGGADGGAAPALSDWSGGLSLDVGGSFPISVPSGYSGSGLNLKIDIICSGGEILVVMLIMKFISQPYVLNFLSVHFLICSFDV
jgi:hypothetical protein